MKYNELVGPGYIALHVVVLAVLQKYICQDEHHYVPCFSRSHSNTFFEIKSPSSFLQLLLGQLQTNWTLQDKGYLA